jgi:hypothetical protein
MMAYGMELLWDHLKNRDLNTWEGVNAKYVTRMPGLQEHTASPVGHVLGEETFFIEDVSTSYRLPQNTRIFFKRESERERDTETGQSPAKIYGT